MIWSWNLVSTVSDLWGSAFSQIALNFKVYNFGVSTQSEMRFITDILPW